MEPDDLGLGSYYHHHHHPQPQPQPQPQPPPQRHPHQQPSQPPTTITNGMLQNTNTDPRPSQILYAHNSAPSAVSSPLETAVRRKRGRPRKYGTPEQAAAAKRLSSSSSPSTSVPPLSPRKKDLSLGVGGSSASTSFKKSSLGNTGQGFIPHVITVTAGEDIGQKIMSFMQQSKLEMCVLSASGSISNASLSQPATSGGNIAYEGRFEILSLCGSYVRTDFGGSTGGLSVCLSSQDGHIIGGSIDGPLIAAGPVQVIVGTFAIEGKKEAVTVIKGDASTKLPPHNVGPPPVPNLGFLSPPESSGRNVVVSGGEEQQSIDGYQFMIANRSLPVGDWRNNNDSRNTGGYDFSAPWLTGTFGFAGRVNHGVHQSPKNGDYDRFQD
ncbi:AT-hook motif nuclear-localized protein 14 isoform X1 [Lactuca sativa]|uniref:AT-hook motif nuclear-localized protein 14 isoform X1 n=1 Tax=Lactuca sativa TaxID=4236 RepID=UPI0022AEB2B8|nr:AT-hook motif nuclear-localized protein 14 isoform X1 [Lactuca sativa]